MDYKARLTLDTSQHDDAINKSAKQVGEYDSKVKQTGTDVRKLIAEERKAARERTIANKRYQDMARSVGDFSRGLTGGISLLGKFSGALAIGATAAKVVSDAFMSTESNIDAWGIKVSQAKAAYDVFVTSLNNGNWSNFFTNLSEAIRGAKELYEKLDDLGSYKASNKAVLALQRATIADLKRRKANGEKDINGKDIDDVIKAAEDRLEEIRRGGIERGKEAGKDYMKKTLEKYNSSLSGVSDSISEQYIKGGYEYLKMQERIRAGYESMMNDTEDIVDEFGNVILTKQFFNPDKLSEAFRRQYDIAVAVTDKEDELSKGIAMYADAVDEETNINQELYRTDKILNSGTTKTTDTTKKLSDEEEELQNALERFKKSIKTAQMRMSALKVWSGITNMSEIDVLENTIKINDDTINGYYDKLKSVGELTDDETNELKQLIETQKGYRRKLNKLKVDEEERRTNADYSGLRKGLPNLNDIATQNWDKYINSFQGSDLFNVWKNGKVHIDNRLGRTDSELIEEYYNEIYNYIQNIEKSRQDLDSYLLTKKGQSFEIGENTDFAKKYEEYAKSFEEYLEEYKSKNGGTLNQRQLSDAIYEYFDKYVSESIGLIDAALYSSITTFALQNKGKIKLKPDSEVLYGIFDYLKNQSALESLFDFNGKFNPDDESQKYIENLTKYSEEFKDILSGDDIAQAFVNDFTSALQNIEIGNIVQNKLNVRFGDAIKKSISEQLKEINWKKYDLTKEQVSVWQNGSNAIRSFAGAWESMQDTLNDEDASGLDKFFAIQDAINSTIDSVFSLIDGYKQLQEIQKTFSTITKQQNALTQEAIALNAAESSTKEMQAASASKAAIAEGTEKAVSSSKHWIEAIAAISAVVAAITAALAISGSFSQGGIVPKFADGGIFSGNRTVGDYNIARVNSGEMILNGSQQSKLFQLLDGAGGFTNNQPSGEVTFRIEGNTLVGVLNNYNKRKSKIV